MAAEFTPGDVVFVPSGPFQGVCGVIREVDTGREELHLDIRVRGGRHGVLVRFDEVEWV
ncbi:hypothetical protein [Nocardia blacklockiae]|uniref:hypothetical protein n=1 Tax=Nocardia blacklockiae TaxID=480036 RepID=UPI001892D2C5|nr:hypothetical protein [Nocardia blacklockiae]MBF6172915.1 hypothetical protein [Nocardia blacklockiae]